MNILVTGGAGFIGTHLIRALRRDGRSIRVFDTKPSPEPVDGLEGDVRSQEALIRATDGVDLVFHLAAEHRDDVRPRSLYYDVNVLGTRNLLRAPDAHDVKRIVFTSTVAVYGLNKGEPDETTALEPFNDYGKSKLEAERLLGDWAEQDEARRVVIVRPTVVFGEGNRGNVNTLIRQIDRGRFLLVGSGKNRKSLCYVTNFVQFLSWLVEQDVGNAVFNYADKPDLTMGELVSAIRGDLGLGTDGGFRVPYWLGLAGGYLFDFASIISGRRFAISGIRIRKFCASTQVATPALRAAGFEADVPLREGLHRTISYMKSENLLDRAS